MRLMRGNKRSCGNPLLPRKHNKDLNIVMDCCQERRCILIPLDDKKVHF